ncbi:MAG: TonB-dependent receptor plug domain-containing protein [Opitutaceae bacterium]|nr:TonB-dependent receptor plug domain-containing protein [Opitutaceae bacterium]
MLLTFASPAAEQPAKRAYDVPAGDAAVSLRLFSEQSGQEIIYPAENVKGVKTNALKGEFTPREAINRLIAGTPLTVASSKNGAIAVNRANAPKAQGGAPTTASSDLPADSKGGAPANRAAATPERGDREVPKARPSASDDTPLVLSPFTITASEDRGYLATSTLAGSRLNTELRDTPAAISVFTKQFLDDIGVTDVIQAMSYTLNGGQEFTDLQGASTQLSDGAIQMRGFVGASLLRDFFPYGRSADVFNTERLDFSRGPNSILFGIGGVGGAVNSTAKQARIDRTIQQVRLRLGSWDDYRATVDANRPSGKNLAVRVNGVYQDRRSWREFDFLKLKGGAMGVAFRPWQNTLIRTQSEYIDRRQIVAYSWGPGDLASPWLAAGKPISATGAAAVAGTEASTSRMLVYDPTSGIGPVSWFGTRISSSPSAGSPAILTVPPAFFHFDIVPRSANLAGPGSSTDNRYANNSVFIEQKLGPLNFELAYNQQDSDRVFNSSVSTANNGVRGDPNAVLTNQPLPDGRPPAGGGAPNPNAGRLYVEGFARIQTVTERLDNFRVTGSYELDLRERNLGKHRIALLGSREQSRRDTLAQSEANITPPGTGFYGLNVTAANNRINRRTYLDFTSGNPALRGAHDPLRFPIVNLNGVTSGFVVTSAGPVAHIVNDAVMIAGQSAFWRNRLHLTGGLRRDKQTVRTGIAESWQRDPVTREFFGGPTAWDESSAAGNTRTYGGVFHLLPVVSLYYNGANNFTPQVQLGIDSRPLGPRTGEGRDFGVKLALLDGRINATLGHYQIRQKNFSGNVGPQLLAIINVINDNWEALNQATKVIDNTNRDAVDNEGRGWELELTASPTPRWRAALNFSQSEVVQSNTFPAIGNYLATNRAEWLRSAGLMLPTPSAQVPANKRTIGGAVETLDLLYGNAQAANGQAPRQHREYTGNLFTSYTFSDETPILGASMIGLGANYRSAPVTGYNSVTARPLLGKPHTLFNVMFGRTFVPRKGLRVRVQLNVDNLLDEDALLIADQDEAVVYRYVFQKPRSWGLSSTINF